LAKLNFMVLPLVADAHLHRDHDGRQLCRF
jgi:hypothetical protein